MKLIKISFFILLLFFPGVAMAEVSANVVKLNNSAAELLKSSLEKKKPKKEESIMNKLLSQFMGKKDSDKMSEVKKKGEENGSPDEKNSKEVGSEFSPGQSKKEKEEASVDTELLHQAYKNSLKATLAEGSLSEIRMNLGLAFELNGENEKAIKSYKMAEKLAGEDPKFKFLSRYNAARVLALEKKVDAALSTYQAALEVYPESKEVKVNIELLIRDQQGGGGGGNKEDESEGDGKRPKPDAPMKENPKNSEYKSQKLSKKNVDKILEELKNQEQKIRAKEYDKGVKEKPRDKDW